MKTNWHESFMHIKPLQIFHRDSSDVIVVTIVVTSVTKLVEMKI